MCWLRIGRVISTRRADFSCVCGCNTTTIARDGPSTPLPHSLAPCNGAGGHSQLAAFSLHILSDCVHRFLPSLALHLPIPISHPYMRTAIPRWLEPDLSEAMPSGGAAQPASLPLAFAALLGLRILTPVLAAPSACDGSLAQHQVRPPSTLACIFSLAPMVLKQTPGSPR